jgi:hypothetical protein
MPQGTDAIFSKPARTAGRCIALDEYMRSHVLDGEEFVCSSGEACRGSYDGAFYEAQAHHIGRHFDLSVDGRPMRIVVTGQEYGHPPSHVTREMRAELIVESSAMRRRFLRDVEHPARNPHMRGTTSLLRLLLGRGLGTDYQGEFIKIGTESVHLFECFALVNFLLCSAVTGEPTKWIEGLNKGGGRGRSTTTMQRNCAAHYRETLQILQPTVIVAQGQGVRRWMRQVLDNVDIVNDALPIESVRIGTLRCHLLTFSHPAVPNRDNWGMNAVQPYLLGTVVPTVAALFATLP